MKDVSERQNHITLEGDVGEYLYEFREEIDLENVNSQTKKG